MLQKTSNSEMVHVKVLAFKIVKYLLDGMIDGEISDDEIENMKQESNGKLEADIDLVCKTCGKKMKTVQGLNIHKAKMHKDILDENITKRDHIDCICKKCNFSFANHEELEIH